MDSWDWSQAAGTYDELLQAGGSLAEVMRALHAMFGPSDLLAYLAMMAARLAALHDVLKRTGSIYLHCDPTASHHLKVIMDAVFGHQNFINEIIWKRSTAHSDKTQGSRHFGRLHDVILLYSKSDAYTWNQLYENHDPKYIESHYNQIEPGTGRRYQLDNLTGPGGEAKGNPQYEVMGVTRYWRYSKERMKQLIADGRIIQSKPGGVPRFKRYLDESKGRPIQDTWTDIFPLNSQAIERKKVGYPTQKPEALMRRIIAASSREGDVVLDPFCGCGTTISAAQQLNRQWIGIDITARAIDIIIDRLRRDFPDVEGSYRVEQYPCSVQDAYRLADDDKFHFQRWALEKLGVDPSDIKPGADRGIDGKLYFADGTSGRTKRVVLSVKGGQRVTPRDVRELRGVLDRDGFQIGVLVSAVKPTDAALADLASGIRHYETIDKRRYPRLQSLTVEDIFDGRRVEYPEADKHRVGILPGAVPEVSGETPWLDFEAEPQTMSRVGKAKTAKAALPTHPKTAQPKGGAASFAGTARKKR